MISHEQLAAQIYDTAHLTGDFLLRSGTRSSEYFDKYRFESEPSLLRQIAQAISPQLPQGIDYLAGLEMGGIPVATALSLETGIPVVFVRKKAKDYGTCKFAEGQEIQGKKLLIIEDVITTGGQVVLSAQDLRGAGAMIESVFCVIDRSGGEVQALKQAGLKLQSLFTMNQIKEVISRR